MGLPGVWAYNEDIGSDIQDIKASVAVIETNKYDKTDLIKLVKAVVGVIVHIIEKDED